MNAIAHIEMPTQVPGASPSTAGQSSDPSSPSFSDALLTATKFSPKAGSEREASDAGTKTPRSSKSDADEDKPSGSGGHAAQQASDSQATVPAVPTVPDPQAQVTIPVVVPVDAQVTSSTQAAVADDTLPTFSGTERASGLQAMAQIPTSGVPVSQSATSSVQAWPSSADPNAATARSESGGKSAVQNGAPTPVQDERDLSFEDSMLSKPTPAAQDANRKEPNLPTQVTSQQGASTSTRGASAAPQDVPASQQQTSSFPPVVRTDQQNTSSPVQEPTPQPVQATQPQAAQPVDQSVSAVVSAIQVPASETSSNVQANTAPQAEPIPVTQAKVKTPSDSADSTTDTPGLASTSDNTTAPTDLPLHQALAAIRSAIAPGAGVNQSHAPASPSVAKASGLKSTGSLKDANSKAELKEDSKLDSAQSNSLDSKQPGDQNQNGAAVTGQIASTIAAPHTTAAISPAQGTTHTAPVQSAPVFDGASATGSKAQQASQAPSPTPETAQTQPVINSARLIQNMGQSEMKVGMRSSEFGNISISTSSTRDSITAQISVDHGELARTLAAHLPEVQARLAGSQMDVRIDMHGTMTGNGGGASDGGAAYSSADQSHSGRNQSGNAVSNYGNDSGVELRSASAVAAISSGSMLSGRLDISA